MTPWFNYPAFDWQTRKAIVIGAGIAGCQMTYQLSQEGWQVTLVDQDSDVSQHASGNLAGVISPKMTAQASDSERFYQAAFEYTTKQLSALQANGTTLDWFPCGMLQLNHNEAETQRWHELKSRNLPTDLIQLLNKEEAASTAGIACDYDASYFPHAGFINPKSFCQALIANSKPNLILSNQVEKLTHDNSIWTLYDQYNQVIDHAEIVILCAGHTLNKFTQSTSLIHTPVLGQTNLANTTDKSQSLNCVICHEGYLTPNYQEKHVFGATFDRQFEEISITDEATLRNTRQLKQYLPEWEQSIGKISNGHSAIRTTTLDRFPYVGSIPDNAFYQRSYESLKHGRVKEQFPEAQYQQGLFVLGGLGARGLTTSGYCAQLLSNLINNKKQDAQLSTMHPARFLIRQLRRGKSII